MFDIQRGRVSRKRVNQTAADLQVERPGAAVAGAQRGQWQCDAPFTCTWTKCTGSLWVLFILLAIAGAPLASGWAPSPTASVSVSGSVSPSPSVTPNAFLGLNSGASTRIGPTGLYGPVTVSLKLNLPASVVGSPALRSDGIVFITGAASGSWYVSAVNESSGAVLGSPNFSKFWLQCDERPCVDCGWLSNPETCVFIRKQRNH